MFYYVKLYLAALAAFLVIDLAWLGWAARSFYKTHLGYLMAPDPVWIAAVLFYLLFVLGVVVLVVVPGLKEGSLKKTVLRAALFGLVCYATYDLTNLAVVKDWPLIVTVVDMLWGTFLSVAVACCGYAVGKRLSASS